ncbi:nuclear transport factor 2 family protein [Nocardia sp. NPDC020380]|uniref:nuclear transport factor 2 family protein n=1 Tax=Nocardia sp. NPDC020380 TaxID=3364309 RepID=UPI0037BA17A7
MGKFSREELEQGLEHYGQVVNECSASGAWSPFADLFTEDVEYIEHAYGIMQGREAVRRWIVNVMKPFPHMRFPHDWVAFDEPNSAIVLGIRNVLDHPTEPGVEYGFLNVSRIVYAGDGLFSSEEDVYNPARDAPRVIAEWIQAGGRMLCAPQEEMKHVVMGG